MARLRKKASRKAGRKVGKVAPRNTPRHGLVFRIAAPPERVGPGDRPIIFEDEVKIPSPGQRRRASPRPIIRLIFSAPKRSTRLGDVAASFANIDSVMAAALETGLTNAPSRRPGVYVASISLNTPLEVTLFGINFSGEWAKAVVQVLDMLVYKRQGRRIRDARAHQIEVDTASRALALATQADLPAHQRERLGEVLVRAAERGTELPVKLKSVHLYIED